MDEIKYNDWKSSVSKLNTKADEVIDTRDEIYEWMASKIKLAFKECDNPIPSIHINDRGTEISCIWFDKVKLHLTKSLIDYLMMEFDFNRRLTDTGEWVKEIVFYPFGREE